MATKASTVSLIGHLLRLSREERERLAVAWGLPATEATPAALYRELTDLWSLGAVLEGLPQVARHVFAAIVGRGSRIPPGNFGTGQPWREDEVAGAVAALAEFGLVVAGVEGNAAEAVVANEVLLAATRLGKWSNSPTPVPSLLHRALERLEYDAVERMARRWGIETTGPWLRSEALSQLRRRMSTRAETRRVAGMLSPEARRVLVALHRAGGYADAGALKAATGLGDRALRDAAREAGEFFPIAESYAGGKRGLVLPVGLGEMTDEVEPGQPSATPRPLPGAAPLGEDFELARDLLLLLAYLRDAEPPVARLPLAGSHVQRLRTGLSPVDSIHEEDRFAFLVGVAQGLRLVEQRGRSVRPSARVTRWEEFDCAAHTLAAYRWWLETDRWREGLRQPDRDLGGPLALALGRERLVQALAECEPGRWYLEDAFLAWLREREPLLFRDRQVLVRAVSQKGLELVARHWQTWDGRVARGALRLSLRWLGFLAYTEASGGPALAVTPLGAWLCGRRGARPPGLPSGPALRFTEDGGVTVAWPSGPALAALLPYAEAVAFGSYRLNAQSVARAVKSGADSERILGDLSQRGEVPTALTEAVREWAGKVRLLRLSSVLLLEAASESDLDALLRSPRGTSLALRRLSPTVGVVGDENALRSLAAQLRREGYHLVDGRDGSG